MIKFSFAVLLMVASAVTRIGCRLCVVRGCIFVGLRRGKMVCMPEIVSTEEVVWTGKTLNQCGDPEPNVEIRREKSPIIVSADYSWIWKVLLGK